MLSNHLQFKRNIGVRLALVSAAGEEINLGEDIHSLLAIYNLVNMLGKHKDSFSVIFEGTSPLIEMAELAAKAAEFGDPDLSFSDEADADVYIVCPSGSSMLDQLVAMFARLADKPAQVYLLDPANHYDMVGMIDDLKEKFSEENCPAFRDFVRNCENNISQQRHFNVENIRTMLALPADPIRNEEKAIGVSDDDKEHLTFFLGTMTMGNIRNVFEIIKLAKLCATNGYGIVYGAEASGLMQALALAARQENGRVVGVSTNDLVAGIEPEENLSLLIHKDELEDRKEVLMGYSQTFVVCAGGPGTMGELKTLLNKYPNGEVAVYLFDPTCVYTEDRLRSIESDLNGGPKANVTYQAFLSYFEECQKNSAKQFFEVFNSNYSPDYEKSDWAIRCKEARSSLEPSQKIQRVEPVEHGVITRASASSQFGRPEQVGNAAVTERSFSSSFS